MVSVIKEFTGRDWMVRVTHVLREGNNVADFLANLGQSMDLGLHLFESPPHELCRTDLE